MFVCLDQNSSNTRAQQDTQQSKDVEGEFHLLIKELKLYRVWIQTYFRMSVGQCDALSQMLVPRLRRKSSNCRTGPTDHRYTLPYVVLKIILTITMRSTEKPQTMILSAIVVVDVSVVGDGLDGYSAQLS